MLCIKDISVSCHLAKVADTIIGSDSINMVYLQCREFAIIEKPSNPMCENRVFLYLYSDVSILIETTFAIPSIVPCDNARFWIICEVFFNVVKKILFNHRPY